MMRTRLLLPIAILAAVAITAGCSGQKPTWTYPPNAPTAGPELAAASGAPTAPEPEKSAVAGTLEIESFDMGFKPAELTVPGAGRYEIKLTNTGTIPHDITFPGGEQAVAGSGETTSVEVDVPADGLSFICSIPGHEQAGMVGTIKVEGAAEG